MSGRRRFICPNASIGRRAVLPRLRRHEADDVTRVAHRSNVRSRVEGPSYIAAKNIHVGGDGRGALLARPKSIKSQKFASISRGLQREQPTLLDALLDVSDRSKTILSYP